VLTWHRLTSSAAVAAYSRSIHDAHYLMPLALLAAAPTLLAPGLKGMGALQGCRAMVG